jgi:uridine kinase
LIGIAGPSCAGKSELSRRLSQTLAAPLFLLDSYYQDLAHLPFEQRAASNFDIPDALDHDLLLRHLRLLALGSEIDKPVYDFTRHLRASEVEHLEPARFVIVEGLFALYWEDVRSLFGTRVFITVADEICLQRRIERDVRERARTPESVMDQYRTTVRPMAEQYIHPTRRYAHLVVSGTDPLERTTAAVLVHVEKTMLDTRSLPFTELALI